MDKLLFIGPQFYNYHKIIKKGFEDAGFEVVYFDDRPNTNFLTKALIRFNKRLLRGKIRKYFERIKETVANNRYDIIFVLYGQSFSKEMMKELRDISPQSRFIFYMYDPFSSMPDRADFSEVFDDCYSFDYQDCINNPSFQLLPLFSSVKEYITEELKYDACAIVTMMPGKYAPIKSMVKELKENGMNVFKMYFLQSKLIWLYYKATKKEFRRSKVGEFSFRRLSNEDSNRIMMQSTYVLDCPKEGQSGLTIRTFEALAANKKFITTNKTIKNYDFYKPENIYVYEGKFDFNNIFFHSSYLPIDEKIKEKYSIDSWIHTILKNYNKKEG